MSEHEPHILVVDDHRDIREQLARYLRKSGLRASVADSAAQARKFLKSAAVDLIVQPFPLKSTHSSSTIPNKSSLKTNS